MELAKRLPVKYPRDLTKVYQTWKCLCGSKHNITYAGENKYYMFATGMKKICKLCHSAITIYEISESSHKRAYKTTKTDDLPQWYITENDLEPKKKDETFSEGPFR